MLDIKDYEAMAMLELEQNERETLARRLEKLCEGFDTLKRIDTRGVSPLVSVLKLQNVLREDITDKVISREAILENAPEQYDGFFQVPGTLE